MTSDIGQTSWGGIVRRGAAALRPRGWRERRPGWALALPVVLVGTGVLFATTARTARGTDLRNDRSTQLAQLIDERRAQVAAAERQAARLRRDIDAATGGLADADAGIRAQQQRADAEKEAAGLVAMTGPGLVVRLDDAPRSPDGSLPDGAGPDDVVVHQQDVQAVVNALWAGGAEAMSLMDVRVISTSAVRCVGNTLLLHGRVYSPPFVITAIGDPQAMLAALDAAPYVEAYRAAADRFGVRYDVRQESRLTVPAFDGSTGLTSARAGR